MINQPPVLICFLSKILYKHPGQDTKPRMVVSSLFPHRNLNGILWVPWSYDTQILSNPMESYGFHEVMTLKSYQIQWNLMGSMRLWHSNLIKSNGILWVPWDFKTQILSNPMESDGFHEVLNIKSIQILSSPKCYGSEVLIIKGWNRKDLTRSIWPCGGGVY